MHAVGLPVIRKGYLSGPAAGSSVALTSTRHLMLAMMLCIGCESESGASPGGASRGGTPALVGEACVPPMEDSPTFSGFGDFDAELMYGSPGCESGICSTWDFIGRVTCPAGQDESSLALPADDPRRCRTPSGEPVTVVVSPQDPNFPPEENVFCTCRCDAEAEAPCQCPSDMLCLSLVEGLSTRESYCVFPHVAERR